MGKREQRSASIKVKVLQSTLELVQTRSFDQVHVQEICDRSEISKVTFFKYFPQKEDIVFYHFRIWCLKLSLQLKKNEKKGLKGIYYVMDEFAQDYISYPSLLEVFVSNLVNLQYAIKPIPVSTIERQMLLGVGDVESIEIQSLGSVVEGFFLEAIMTNEITQFSDTKEMKNLVLALLYGLVLSAKLHQISEFRIQVRRALDHLLSSWR